jgi:ABC-type phosphate transport system permease subunit
MRNHSTGRFRWRMFKNHLATTLSILCVLLAIAPLIMIFSYTLIQGIGSINLDFFVQMPKPVGDRIAYRDLCGDLSSRIRE